jgi:hypothetical protein
MLRCVVLGLLGLSVLAGPVEARGDGSTGGGGGRRAAVYKGGIKAERAFLLRRVAASSRSAPSGLNCGRVRGGALRCRGAAQAVSLSWTHGLPPALNVQTQACPAGTMATLAEGHDDIVRCIPI